MNGYNSRCDRLNVVDTFRQVARITILSWRLENRDHASYTRYGILLRWEAGERIPAANMYESMLFLAWGVGLFAVIAYGLMRNRVVVLNAAVMATLTMALVDLLPIDRFIHPIAPVVAAVGLWAARFSLPSGGRSA